MRTHLRLLCLITIAGCGFRLSATPTSGDASNPLPSDSSPPSPDASIVFAADAAPDAMVDARCFGTGLVHGCLDELPTQALFLPFSPFSSTLDTTSDFNCTMVVPQPNGPDLCVLAGTTITVAGHVLVIGTRALVLVATDTIVVTGAVDVSSAGFRIGGAANATVCSEPSAAPTTGGDDSNGGGGGGGGAFATDGGDGGIGDHAQGSNNSTGTRGVHGHAQLTPSVLRGGCPGAPGGHAGQVAGAVGGASGGAVELIARYTVVVTGSVYASGAGASVLAGTDGAAQGGGGGGSGGMIVLDAPQLSITGSIAANGSAGSGGGGQQGGNPGEDGSTTSYDAIAAGGTGGPGDDGTGGAGGHGTAINATIGGTGSNAVHGGGGGGGGIGIVELFGNVTGNPQISPPPTPPL